MNRQSTALCAALVVVLTGCQGFETVPETGRRRPELRYTEAEMAQLGASAYEEALKEYTVRESGPEVEMLQSVGKRLAAAAAKDYEWEFKLIESDTTVNAFCLPGGKVAVFTGILPICAGERGLAVVLSHEIAHATLQHSNERLSQRRLKTLLGRPLGFVTDIWGAIAPGTRKLVMDGLGLGALFGKAMPWNQEHETEADEVGLLYMERARFDLDEAPLFWERMAHTEAPGQISDSLSTHPGALDRAKRLRRLIAEKKAEAKAAEKNGAESKETAR